jgi:hypothetical protein
MDTRRDNRTGHNVVGVSYKEMAISTLKIGWFFLSEHGKFLALVEKSNSEKLHLA